MTDEQPMQDANQAAGFSWRKLLSFASFGAALVLVLVSVFIFKAVEVPFIVMIVLFIVGGILSRRTGKAGVVGVVLSTLGAAMFTAFAGPFAFAVIGIPEAKDQFIPVLATLTMALTVLISAIILSIRGRGQGFVPSRAAGGLGTLAVVLVIAVVGWSLYASSGIKSVSAQEDDILLVAEDLKFGPQALSAKAGTISVHVTNKDDTTHTFTIDELDVDMVVPPGKSLRTTFTVEEGSFRFYCKPHAPDMDGKLGVS